MKPQSRNSAHLLLSWYWKKRHAVVFMHLCAQSSTVSTVSGKGATAPAPGCPAMSMKEQPFSLRSMPSATTVNWSSATAHARRL